MCFHQVPNGYTTATTQHMTHDELGIQISWPSDPGEIPRCGHLWTSWSASFWEFILGIHDHVPFKLCSWLRSHSFVEKHDEELTASVMKKWFYAKKISALFWNIYGSEWRHVGEVCFNLWGPHEPGTWWSSSHVSCRCVSVANAR